MKAQPPSHGSVAMILRGENFYPEKHSGKQSICLSDAQLCQSIGTSMYPTFTGLMKSRQPKNSYQRSTFELKTPANISPDIILPPLSFAHLSSHRISCCSQHLHHCASSHHGQCPGNARAQSRPVHPSSRNSSPRTQTTPHQSGRRQG